MNEKKRATFNFPFVKSAKADWLSSDIYTVPVSPGGVVTGMKYGTGTVSCSYEGFKFETKAYVENPEYDIDDKRFVRSGNKYYLTLEQGDVFNRVKLKGIYQTVIFKSNKNAVAFVDENGLIYARSRGKANVTAKINGKSFTIQVTVQ